MSPEDIAQLVAANPFPGLRSFDPEDAAYFFGRGEQIASLVARMRETRLVAVSGASGCGKSSLVKAGLISALRQRGDGGDGLDWHAAVMRPGNRPFARLAEALAPVLDLATRGQPADAADASADRVGALHGELQQGGLSLLQVIARARLPPEARLLLVVDQFEEIFRLYREESADEATAFVKLLLQTLAQPESPVQVILTLRSDTLGGCADFPGLPEAVSAGSYFVPRLTRAQRKEAITGPIALRGRQITPQLVQRVLGAVSSDFDDLPVMQHALSRTWARWARDGDPERPIGINDYKDIGEADKALAQHADEARNELERTHPPGQEVERVFRALTQRVAGGLELRRPLRLGELCSVCDDGTPGAVERVRAVVARYRRPDTAFLLPAGSGTLPNDTLIDISHESLIRLWPTCRTWLDNEADWQRTLAMVDAEAKADNGTGKRLLQQPELGQAMAWRDRHRPTAAWARRYGVDFDRAMDFLDRSHEAERKGQDRRARRQRRWVACGVVAGLLLLLSVLSWTVREVHKRNEQMAAVQTLKQNRLFFAALRDAAEDRRSRGETAAPTPSRPCAAAKELIDDLDWRKRQYSQICVEKWIAGDGTLNGDAEIQRLRSSMAVSVGDVADAMQMFRAMSGRNAVRVFVQLERLAELEVPDHWQEAQALGTLLPLAEKKTAVAPSACKRSFEHPVHESIRRRQCADGTLTNSEIKLLRTYAEHLQVRFARKAPSAAETTAPAQAEADATGSESPAQPAADQAGEQTPSATPPPSPYYEVDKTLPPPSVNSDDWFYVRMVVSARRSAHMSDRLGEMLNVSSGWWFELVLLALPALWRVWRTVRRRMHRPVSATPMAPLRAVAELFDLLIAAALSTVLVLVILAFEDLGMYVPIEDDFSAVMVSMLPAVVYLLGCDVLHLRYQRSIGHVLFGLRCVAVAAGTAPVVAYRRSMRRHAPALLLLLVLLGAMVQTVQDASPDVLRWVLGGIWAVLLVVLLIGKGRNIGDRLAGVRVIDVDSAESRSLESVPRYPRARPSPTADTQPAAGPPAGAGVQAA